MAYRVLSSVWRALARSWCEWILYLSLKVLGAKWMFMETLMIWEGCGMKALEIDMIWKVRLIVPVDCQRPCMWSLYSLKKIQGDWKPWWRKKRNFSFPSYLLGLGKKKLHFQVTEGNMLTHVFQKRITVVSVNFKLSTYILVFLVSVWARWISAISRFYICDLEGKESIFFSCSKNYKMIYKRA